MARKANNTSKRSKPKSMPLLLWRTTYHAPEAFPCVDKAELEQLPWSFVGRYFASWRPPDCPPISRRTPTEKS
jgi:hypothetical protein